MPLEEVPSLGRDFDFVVSTGVLHHLEKTETGLTALRKITRKEGSLLVALYGRYGRVGVEILQHFYRAINLTPSKKNLETLRQTLRLLDKKHHPFFSNMDWYGADLYNPSGLVDLLLQKKERLFSVPELGALVEQCGLVVQEFVFRSRYEPSCSALAETPIMSGLGKRPQQDQYAAVELFRATLHMHTVILCRKDRPLKTRQIELSDTAWKSYIPLPNKALCFEKRNCPAMAHTVGFLPGNRYFNIRSPLSGEEWRLLRLVDGTRSFGEILTRSGHPKNEKRIREFFQKMREHEFLFLRGNPDNQEG